MDNSHASECERLKRKTKQTAIDRYGDHYRDTTALMRLLHKEMGIHRKNALQQPFEWGFAGELGYVRRVLKDILLFLIVSRVESKTDAAGFIDDFLEANKREKPKP